MDFTIQDEGKEIIVLPLETYDNLRLELKAAQDKIATFDKLKNNSLDVEWFFNYGFNILNFKIKLNDKELIEVPLQMEMNPHLNNPSPNLLEYLSNRIVEFMIRDVLTPDQVETLIQILSYNIIKDK